MAVFYVLAEDGRTPVPSDAMGFARWVAKHGRHVGDDKKGDIRVSTVFLGIDHRFGSGPPILWETLVFMQDGEDGERYETYEAAKTGHARYVAKYLGGD